MEKSKGKIFDEKINQTQGIHILIFSIRALEILSMYLKYIYYRHENNREMLKANSTLYNARLEAQRNKARAMHQTYHLVLDPERGKCFLSNISIALDIARKRGLFDADNFRFCHEIGM